jgi:hypothetical protein
MKSFLVLMLCGLAAQATKTTNNRVQKLVQSLSQTSQGSGHSCSYSINRWKNTANVNASAIIEKGIKFTDTEFPTSDAVYWTDYNLGS